MPVLPVSASALRIFNGFNAWGIYRARVASPGCVTLANSVWPPPGCELSHFASNSDSRKRSSRETNGNSGPVTARSRLTPARGRCSRLWRLPPAGGRIKASRRLSDPGGNVVQSDGPEPSCRKVATALVAKHPRRMAATVTVAKTSAAKTTAAMTPEGIRHGHGGGDCGEHRRKFPGLDSSFQL